LEGLLQANEGDAQKCRQTLAMVENQLGQVLVTAGRDDEAIAPIERASAAYLALHGADVDNPSHLEGLVRASINLANALRTSGRSDEEHVLLTRAIHDSTVLINAMTDVLQFKEYRAIAQTNLARVLHYEHANAEAGALLEEAIPVFVQLANSPFASLSHLEELAIAYTIRGQVLRDLDELDSAEKELRKALGIYEGLMKAQPKLLQYVQGAAHTSRHLARLEHRARNVDMARDEYAAAIAGFQNVLERRPGDRLAVDGLAVCLEHLGDLMHNLQEPDEASKCYEEALVHRRQLPEYPMYELRKAALLLKIGNSAEALPIAKAQAENNPDNGMFATIFGAAQLRTEEADQCIRTLEGLAPEIRERACPELEFWLAMAYGERNEPDDAEEAKETFDRAVKRMTSQAPGCVALLQLRAEAAEKLGIEDAENAKEEVTPEANDEMP